MVLRFRGARQLRQRLVFATLAGRSIRVDGIRADDAAPGLRDYEASLLRLLEKVTNGCLVEINETGTTLRYRPGVIVGGVGLAHDCPPSRAVGYFLEPLVLLALFAKKPLDITLRGVTNDALDPSADVFRTVTLPLLRRAAGLSDGPELRIARRGARPGGGGEVALRVAPVKARLPPVSLVDEGMVKRVRGIAYAMRVPPQNANRMVDGARGVLNALLADVYVFTDAASGQAAGASPGFGAVLVAETTSGALISAEACATQQQQQQQRYGGGSGGHGGGEEHGGGKGGGGDDGPLVVPEDVGVAAARLLLDEVSRGGVADGGHQGLLLTLAALSDEAVSTVRLGPLTPHAVRTLRALRDFFGVTFDLQPERGSGTIILKCIGCALQNLNRKIT